MKVAIFSARDFEKPFLTAANEQHGHELVFFESTLDEKTAILAAGFAVVCCFVTDKLPATVLAILEKNGTRLIALRSAGFNHVDLPVAKNLGLTVARVPAYSPYAVAEFAVGLILTLNRKIHHAYKNCDSLKRVGFEYNEIMDKGIDCIKKSNLNKNDQKIITEEMITLINSPTYLK